MAEGSSLHLSFWRTCQRMLEYQTLFSVSLYSTLIFITGVQWKKVFLLLSLDCIGEVYLLHYSSFVLFCMTACHGSLESVGTLLRYDQGRSNFYLWVPWQRHLDPRYLVFLVTQPAKGTRTQEGAIHGKTALLKWKRSTHIKRKPSRKETRT